MAESVLVHRNSCTCVALVLTVLSMTGCEEIGLTNKQSAEPAGEPTADASLPQRLGMVNSPPITAPQSLPTVGEEFAAAASPTPEQSVAALKTKASFEITDADLARVASMVPANADITELDLKGAKITKEGLAQLAALPGLRSVNLTGCGLLGADWAGLSTAIQLEQLNLESAAINDESLAAIAPLVNLKSLNISRTQVTDAGFIHLTKLSRLESISCGNLIITGAGFEAFTGKHAGAPLREINVNNTGFGTYGFQHIDGMKSLQVLAAGTAGVNDQALQALRGMKDMRVLSLTNNAITDQGLKILSGMDELEELDVSGNALVSNFTMGKLKGHKHLRNLRVESTACDLAGVQELKKLLPECKILFMGMEY
jgi:Leucine-rich repeat (LRR) protein